MKIGLIKETKTPVDNRVALSPEQIAMLQKEYPQHQFVVQSSPIRAYTDREYIQAGIQVCRDVNDCDLLFGIKEADIDSLIPDKHYFFFGHIAKMQEYNRPLIQALIRKRITFSDYEYLVDDKGVRVCAFGWWAGIVGTYYTLQGYGLRHKLYELPKPDLRFTLNKLKAALCSIELPAVKIIITGAGRVSQGARYILQEIGAKEMTEQEFLSTPKVNTLSYCVADVDKLVKHRNGQAFTWEHFSTHAHEYESDFSRFAHSADILICAHFWGIGAPVYLSRHDLQQPQLRIRFIGDITCDIMGSIQSTLRSSTHQEPFYDYNPHTGKEEKAFSSNTNITTMAVDTCPNALAMDTSAYFGDMLIKHVFRPLLQGEHSPVIQRGTLLCNGVLTPAFEYLDAFAKGK